MTEVRLAVKLIVSRYDAEKSFYFDTVDEALESAWGNLEFNTAFPLDLYADDKLLYTNRGGHPLRKDSVPLLDAIRRWAEINRKDGE